MQTSEFFHCRKVRPPLTAIELEQADQPFTGAPKRTNRDDASPGDRSRHASLIGQIGTADDNEGIGVLDLEQVSDSPLGVWRRSACEKVGISLSQISIWNLSIVWSDHVYWLSKWRRETECLYNALHRMVVSCTSDSEPTTI
jgi:hypothetical protein